MTEGQIRAARFMVLELSEDKAEARTRPGGNAASRASAADRTKGARIARLRQAPGTLLPPAIIGASLLSIHAKRERPQFVALLRLALPELLKSRVRNSRY